MPVTRIEIKNEGYSQRLFQEAVMTVPVGSHFGFADLLLTIPGERPVRIPMMGEDTFPRFRKGCFPLLLAVGWQIEQGELQLISWMKSSVYLSRFQESSSVMLRVAGDTIHLPKADPDGEIENWFNRLAETFSLEVKG